MAWSDVSTEGATPEEMQQFSNEVEILRAVDSEYIIHYYDSWVDKEKEKVVIITQYMPSGTILKYIRNKNVSIHAIKKWAVQILKGLNYLHSRDPPIIHKDLKCANLFIDGVVSMIRIGDLGLASHSNRESPISGTLPYMAPEIIDSNVYNEKTDMYAFGMCLLEILTKKTPYSECQSTSELLSKILSDQYPEALNEVSDPDFRHLIKQLLGKPEERPTTTDLLLDSFLMQDGDETPISQRESFVETPPLENWTPVTFPRLCMLLKDNGEDTWQDGQKEGNVGSQEEDELTIIPLARLRNTMRFSVVRRYSTSEKPPIKLSVQFSYGEDHIESFVSSLSRMGLISERMIEGTAHNMYSWLNQLLLKENRSAR